MDAVLLSEILGALLQAVFPQSRGLTSRMGYVAIVMAGLVAFFFPVSATAGTETTTLRTITVATLVAAAVLFFAARGGRTVAIAGGAVLVTGGVLAHAPWLFAFAALFAVWFAVATLRDTWSRNRQGPPPVPDRPDDGESVSDMVESVATAFILALVVREFAFEAFKIPTGSMEPTINGEGYGSREGDRLLAAKAPLLFAEPKRWSIIVFKYPLFRPTNFIKRLIGLPGEHLENRGGDIYVNGKCVAKPDEVQETLWFPLAPDESGEWRGGIAASFVAEGGSWKFDGDGASGSASAEKPSWIIHDSNYGDVRATFDVDPSKLGATDGAVLVRIDGNGRRVDLEATRDEMWLTAPGLARTKLDVAGLGTSPSRLGFAVADRVVRVYRDGRLVARVETGDEPNATGRGNQTSIGVRGGDVKLSKIKLEHDLQYSARGAGDWQIPEGCYFMLGDNTNASRDSREWRGQVFRTKDGQEFVCDESSVRVDESQAPKRAVTDRGDNLEMYDSYGVHRLVAKSDLVETNPPNVPQPFVKRDDLVGRAFFIFWPFPPKGAWRPRILP